MLRKRILEQLAASLHQSGFSSKNVTLIPPKSSNFGDYATPIALSLAKELKQSPMKIGNIIADSLADSELIEKAEVIQPGFVNIWLNKKARTQIIKNILENTLHYENVLLGKHKTVLVEYAHPNTHKLFHIGHLRNIITGEAIARLLEISGNTIKRVNYQGDVGLHIAKTLWQIRNEIQKRPIAEIEELHLTEKIAFMGTAYAKGNTAYEQDDKAKQEIIDINKQIFKQDENIISLWKITRQWSLEYFDTIYKRVNTTFDRLFFESEMAQRAVELSNEALQKGILEKSDGAIVLNGTSHGVHTRVFINSIGLPTYEGKELALAEKEFTEFGSIDKIIHVVTAEQSSFFATTFKAEELIDPHMYKGKQYHLVYGWVDVKGNKMSSRKGNVVEGEWLLNETKRQIQLMYNNSEEIAEALAIAAVKYSFLKNNLQSDIEFDLEKAISIQGESGPYLLYTYVRCTSVLEKAKALQNTTLSAAHVSDDEMNLLRLLTRFPEIVQDAATNFAPNQLCTYLFEVAQLYNLFYQKHPILKASTDEKQNRIVLTQATARVLQNGLKLLGIATVERM